MKNRWSYYGLLAIAALYICLPLLIKPAPAEAGLFARRHAAVVPDKAQAAPPHYTLEIYKDKTGDWRWHAKGLNHKILADCAEGYRHRRDMIHAMRILFGDTLYYRDLTKPTSKGHFQPLEKDDAKSVTVQLIDERPRKHQLQLAEDLPAPLKK